MAPQPPSPPALTPLTPSPAQFSLLFLSASTRQPTNSIKFPPCPPPQQGTLRWLATDPVWMWFGIVSFSVLILTLLPPPPPRGLSLLFSQLYSLWTLKPRRLLNIWCPGLKRSLTPLKTFVRFQFSQTVGQMLSTDLTSN